MRRIINLIVIALILMLMVGCANTSNDIMIDEKTLVESNNSYDSIIYDFENINGEICSIKMIDNDIYVQSYEEKDNSTYYTFYRCDENNAIPIVSLEKDKYISAVTVIGEKVFYLLRDNISNQLIEKLYVCDNNDVLSVDIGDILNSNKFDIIKLEKSKDKLLILADNVYVFDQNLEYVKTINYVSDGKLIDTAISGNDKIICAFSNDNPYKNECTIYEFDVIDSKWSELIELDYNYTNIVINGYNNNFLYKCNDGIYSFDLETNETNKVLDYSDSYMSVDEIDILESKNNNEFISLYESDEKINLIAYEHSDSDDDRNTILLGCYHCDYNIKNEIIEYNKTNSHYKIIIKDYAEYDNPELEINKDFSSDASPDILIFNNKNQILNVDTFIQRDYLEDVTGYFENTFNSNEYIVNILNAMKTKDKMYFVSPYFELNVITVQKQLYSHIPEWNIKTIIEYVEKNNIKLTGSTGDYFSLLTGNESMSPFYDYENKKAYFDDESFEMLMNFDPQIEYVDFSSITEDDYINQLVEDEEKFKNGEILMDSVDMTFENYSYTKQRFGKDVCFVSYPGEDGIKLTFPIMIGVSKNSNNKDESWEFIKRIMSKEYQYKCMDHYIPVRRDVFDMLVKEKTTIEPYTDVYGKSVEPMNESYEAFGRQFNITPLSEEQIDEFVGLIDDVKGRRIYDLNILEIVDEEIFSDDKQEKKIKSIQDRVTVYLNEQE